MALMIAIAIAVSGQNNIMAIGEPERAIVGHTPKICNWKIK